jgi:hypothetical protein
VAEGQGWLKVKGGFGNQAHLTRIFKQSRGLVSA